MSFKHPFLFSPQEWLGDGTITFNEFGHELKFYTRWSLSEATSQVISYIQEIEVEGLIDKTHNRFILNKIQPERFEIILENDSLGKVQGKGVVDAKTIGWEFRNKELGFEGFEFYELQEDGNYLTRGEYISVDQLRTIISGRIWKKKGKASNKKAERAND